MYINTHIHVCLLEMERGREGREGERERRIITGESFQIYMYWLWGVGWEGPRFDEM